MIYHPTRRELIRYGIGAAAFARMSRGQSVPLGSVAPVGSAASPVLSHTFVTGNGNTTTPPINTTGATLLLAGFASSGYPTTSKFADSASNSWQNAAPSSGHGGTNYGGAFWCNAPTTSASHTLSFTGGAGYYQTMFFAAFSAASINYRITYNAGTTYAAYDVVADNLDANVYVSLSAGNLGHQPSTSPTYWSRMATGAGVSSASTIQGGAVTPASAGSLVISICSGNDTGSTYSVNSGFTLIDHATGGSTWQGGGWAWLLSGSAQNPTWTMAGGNAPRAFCSYNFYLKD